MTGRLRSLDAFRGLTIAGMLLVNNPGSWAHVYAPLDHAPWHGWTPTDLIFPFFLFIVGIAIELSLGRRIATGAPRGGLIRKILVRGAIIFLLGLLLNGFPSYHLATIRIMGVLQRIALVYVATALLFLTTTPRVQWGIAVGLLLGYWAALLFIPVPGAGVGILDPDGNLPQYVDRIVLGTHRWKLDWDPEGILSTFPAIVTCLLGVVCGRWLVSDRPSTTKVAGLFVAGSAGVIAGTLWGLSFPINKNLWTGSYVLLTAGFASMVLGVCYWAIELRGRTAWAGPWFVLGANAILAFVLSGLFTRCLTLWKVFAGGGTTTLYDWIYEHWFASWAGPLNGSLAFALAYVLLFIAILWFPYRKGWFLKI